MEEARLRRNLSLIRSVMERADVNIILAFKAFALWKSFGIFREYIDSTTASSPFEAIMAMEKFGKRAHAFSPAYTEDDFDIYLRCCSHITFNSLSQYERFCRQAEGVSCGLRINPEYSEIETELYNPCAPGSRFGVTADELEAYAGRGPLPHGIEGLHCHCHCENDSYTLERTLRHLEERFAPWLHNAKWLNLGGGHLMTRDGYDTEHLIRLLNGLHERYPGLQIIMEPGSAFAWQTGWLESKVVDIVENHGIRTAILDVSFTCHMPDCLEMPYFPEVRGAEHVEDKTPGSYRLGGNSCLSGDFMGAWRFDHELQVGEKVIFEDMIHYTTVKTNMFNGIQHPSIAMLHTDGTLETFKHFTVEDYLNRMC